MSTSNFMFLSNIGFPFKTYILDGRLRLFNILDAFSRSPECTSFLDMYNFKYSLSYIACLLNLFFPGFSPFIASPHIDFSDSSSDDYDFSDFVFYTSSSII
jgi:hypothetical protein